jgi:C1A family cysteine protease
MPVLNAHVYQGEELADSVNWVTAGAVTPIKDQGQCGSCWAFGTIGGIEGSWQIATGSLKSMSEQQLVDCSKFPNMGCSGGNPSVAVGFETSHNVCSESSYPYKAVKGSCQGDTSCQAEIPAGGVTGYNQVGSGLFGANVNDMKSALQQQPVTIAIEADQASFQGYQSGILTSGCGTNLDHAVLAVGYGSESGTDYWLVKNSWGTSWGDAGYIKIGIANNVCGVLNQAGYPSVSASVAV